MFENSLILISILIGTTLGASLVYLLYRNRFAERLKHKEIEIQKLSEAFTLKEDSIHVLQTQILELRTSLTQSETEIKAERRSVIEKQQLLERVEQRFTDTFKALSSEALHNSNKSFLDLANATFEKFQESAKGEFAKKHQSLTDNITPIKQILEKFDEKVNALELNRQNAYTGISEQIKNLLHTQAKLETETSNLSKALRNPNVRGQWGEMQLRRTVELAGMLNHVDFTEQTTVSSEIGIQRPDMVIKLPNGRNVVVDAKAPLTSYLEAIESKDPSIQTQKLKDHARHIKDHLVKLSSKNYWKQFEHSPEFVVLFLPGEAFFSAALEQDPELVDFGANNRVILTTPTTLIALLKAVAYGWKQESVASEAKIISELGAMLYERVSTMASHFSELRKGLERTVVCYNKAVVSMETRVLPAARKFKELHSTTDQEIPVLENVETPLTFPKSEELATVET